MKKILIAILCLIIVVSLTACGKKEEEKETKENMENKITDNSKSVVLYFSATGTTANVAKLISDETNSDLIEIEPVEKYTEEDLDYNSDCRANKEQNDDKSRPAIKNDINIDQYDTIYIGYPIWWGTNPKIILTLLDNLNFDGKNVALFCTSGSSGIEESADYLKEYNSNINWLGAKRFESSPSKEDITKWVEDIKKNTSKKMYVKVNNKILTVTLENNSSSEALIEKLEEKDLTIDMSDYGNFEKVGKLGFSLPTNDKEITTTPGDVILYQGNSITIYYDKNTWDFTKLGHINDITKEELKSILGSGAITVTFSLDKD